MKKETRNRNRLQFRNRSPVHEYLAGQKLIERATRKGLFNQVIINPVEPINNNLNETE